MLSLKRSLVNYSVHNESHLNKHIMWPFVVKTLNEKLKGKDFLDKKLTSESCGSHLIYFLMNSIIYATCFVPSTCHFFFTMIGASPAAFSKTSTTTTKISDKEPQSLSE